MVLFRIKAIRAMAKIKCFFLKVFCDGVLVMIVTMAVMMKIVVTMMAMMMMKTGTIPS